MDVPVVFLSLSYPIFRYNANTRHNLYDFALPLQRETKTSGKMEATKNKKGLIALALGTFGLGIAEFAMMAVLPYVAKDINVEIASAGKFVSCYSAGVGIGSLLLIWYRRFPLKYVLMGLMANIIIGNILASISSSAGMMMAARFLSGLPHGAFFGTGAVVAERLAEEGKGNRAVAVMMTGMMVANLLGVPAATALGTFLSWRMVFLIIGCWSMLVLLAIWRLVPDIGTLPKDNLKDQLTKLRNIIPWIFVITTMTGNASIFAWYGFINPLLTQVAGFSANSITFLMVLSGASMVAGNFLSGNLSDKYSPLEVVAVVQGCICITLISIFFFAANPFICVVLMMLGMALFSALCSPEQVLFIEQLRGCEMLGMTLAQIGFNLGGVIGVQSASAMISKGYTYNYTALAGSIFALVGCILLTTIIIYKNKKFNN